MEVVAMALGAIYAAANDMRESRELCQDVCERLRFIVEKLQWMERRGLRTDGEIVHKLQALEEDFQQFLEKHRGRAWVYRIVTSKLVFQQVGDFQKRIETLMLMFNMCNHAEAAAERVRMERFRQDQEALIARRLTNDSTIALEMAREEHQVEALSVLRHEFTSSRMTGYQQLAPSADAEVLEIALRKVMRYSTVAVEQLPAWFLPLSRVEIEPTPFAGGSFGQVHRGRMGSLDVVVKRLAVDTRCNKTSTAQFRDEASLWFTLHHKHVLKMYGACDVSSPPFIVCERAAHGNLSEFLGDEHRRPATLRLLLEAAQGLAFLHESRVVHADLKCDNILVMADESAKIADFSFSFVRALSESRSSGDPPASARRAGAVRWRAPECLRGRSPAFASDVYSFGMCVIEAVSCEFPWGICVDEGTVRDLVRKGCIPSKPAAMTEPVWSLVKRMCCPEPACRPSMQTVVEELRSLAALSGSDGAGASPLYPRVMARADTWQPSSDPSSNAFGELNAHRQRSQSAPTYARAAQQPTPCGHDRDRAPSACVGKCASYVTFELFPNQMLGVTLVEPKGELINRGVGITDIMNPWLATTLQQGDLIVAIGTYSVHRLTLANALNLLHKLPRPITITFEKRSGGFVYDALPLQDTDALRVHLDAFSVVFDTVQTGLVLEDSACRGVTNSGGVVVHKVRGAARASGKIAAGDLVYKVNDTLLLKLPVAEAEEAIRTAVLPKTLHFVPASKSAADVRRFITCA